MTSTQEETVAEETFDAGMGGPLYTSEADVWRDAYLTPPSIRDRILNDARFSTFSFLAAQTGMFESLDDDLDYTIVAPTNAAFAAMSRDDLNALLSPAGKADLKALMEAHIIPGKLPGDMKLYEEHLEETRGNSLIVVTKYDNGAVSFNNSAPDLEVMNASNGVIYVSSDVMTPEIW